MYTARGWFSTWKSSFVVVPGLKSCRFPFSFCCTDMQIGEDAKNFPQKESFFFSDKCTVCLGCFLRKPQEPKAGATDLCVKDMLVLDQSAQCTLCKGYTNNTSPVTHTHTHTHTHTGIIYFSPGLGKFQSQASLETKGCLSYRPNRSALKTLIHPTPNLLLRPGESFPWCWTDLSVEIRLGRNPLRFRASDPSAALHGSSYIMFSSLIVERSTSCCLGSSGMAVINALQSRQGNVIRVAQSFCFWRSRMIL